MDKLIEALQIIRSYGNVEFPTHCEHDVLYVGSAVHTSEYSEEDLNRLEELHFSPDNEFSDGYMFTSFFFGSC